MKSTTSYQHNGMQFLTSLGFGGVGIAIAIIGITTPMYAVVGLAFLMACLLVRARPDIMLTIIMAAAFFQKDISGGGKDSGGGGSVAFSMAELLLAATLPVFLATCIVDKRPPRVGPIAVPVLIYLGSLFYSVGAELAWTFGAHFVTANRYLSYCHCLRLRQPCENGTIVADSSGFCLYWQPACPCAACRSHGQHRPQ